MESWSQPPGNAQQRMLQLQYDDAEVILRENCKPEATKRAVDTSAARQQSEPEECHGECTISDASQCFLMVDRGSGWCEKHGRN